MSKTIKKKICKFVLEPDGFSIHTFELSRQLTGHEYSHMKDYLYTIPKRDGGKQRVYKDDYGVIRCELFNDHGIRVRLEKNESKEERFVSYYLRMIVNPKRLIYPGGDCRDGYLGIFTPGEDSVRDMAKAFTKVFRNTKIPCHVDDYKISRLDLCVNIRSSRSKILRELVRVLRKLPTPSKYERKRYTSDDKMAANAYNKHYIRFACKSHDMVIYDKTYQITTNNLAVAYEKLPEGVLRIELHCKRDYLRSVEKEYGIDSSLELIRLLMAQSEKRIIKNFSWWFYSGMFCQIDEIERRILASRFGDEKKAAMLELSWRMQRTQNLDKALKVMENAGADRAQLLEGFQTLGISPIPLRQDFTAPCLPGIVELLKGVAKGEVSVEYIKVKKQ